MDRGAGGDLRVFAARVRAIGGSPFRDDRHAPLDAPALAWTEIAAAILFVVPFTTLLGGYLLLMILFLAAVMHILHGEFDIGALLVYAMAVLVSMAYGSGGKSETAHDGQRTTERI